MGEVTGTSPTPAEIKQVVDAFMAGAREGLHDLLEARDIRIASLEKTVEQLGKLLDQYANSATRAVTDLQRVVLELQRRGSLQ